MLLLTFPVILGIPKTKATCCEGALISGGWAVEDQQSGWPGTEGFPGTLDFYAKTAAVQGNWDSQPCGHDVTGIGPEDHSPGYPDHGSHDLAG